MSFKKHIFFFFLRCQYELGRETKCGQLSLRNAELSVEHTSDPFDVLMMLGFSPDL